MKEKIDVEFYIIWIGKFRGISSSNFGYHEADSIAYPSEAELDKNIEIYLKEHSDMTLDKKIKQRRARFVLHHEAFDLIAGEEIFTTEK